MNSCISSWSWLRGACWQRAGLEETKTDMFCKAVDQRGATGLSLCTAPGVCGNGTHLELEPRQPLQFCYMPMVPGRTALYYTQVSNVGSALMKLPYPPTSIAPEAAPVFADTLHVQHERDPRLWPGLKTTQSRCIIAWNFKRLVGSHVILAVFKSWSPSLGIPLRVLASMTGHHSRVP